MAWSLLYCEWMNDQVNDDRIKMKILWSIDVFDDLPEVRAKSIRVLRRLAQGRELSIDPVSVLNPAVLGVDTDFVGPWTETYAPLVKKALTQALKDVDLPGLQEARVLGNPRASLGVSVDLLVKHAVDGEYDLILTGSHGRKGLSRMVLGSFAESLLLRTKTPVLVVGNHADPWGPDQDVNRPLHFLFANDLADPHSGLLDEVFQAAAIYSAKVTILSVIPTPAELAVQSGIYLLSGGWVSAADYVNLDWKRRLEVGNAIALRAKEFYDVVCEVHVDECFPAMSIGDSICAHAKSLGVDFIAMAAEDGPVATALIGAISRKVVRSAPCPVWIFRSKKGKKA